tara:strand:+ start:9638 stop:10570 length:933 start_codon:yes stop_codon:yes gene_type:complete
MLNTDKSIVQEIKISSLKDRGISLFVKRDDLIHETISGNKWRKLRYNIESCFVKKKQGIVTFGGAYSNHLIATASACHKVGLKSIGIVRGNELNSESNETLKACSFLGMELVFVSREDYNLRIEKAYLEGLSIKHANYLIVPEGGANYLGMIGCQEILKEIEFKPDHIFVAQGTTTTSCGLAMGLNQDQKIHVVPALKGFDSLGEMENLYIQSGMDNEWIEQLLSNVEVHSEYHFGGYGKYDADLLIFIKEFYQNYDLKLDPIYTGKTMFALMKEIEDLSYNNKSILFVHTGGLQGVSSIEEKSGFELFE